MIFSMLFNMETLTKILINTLVASIPEELYLVMFTYILMGEFDHWKNKDFKNLFYKWDYPRILIPVLVSAFLSNIFRYTGASSGIVSLATLLPLLICIILLGDITNNASALKWIGKAFISLLAGILSVTVIEVLYIPFFSYGTGISIQEFNNDILLNFLLALPERLIEFLILLYLVASKRTFLKAKFIKVIFENRLTATITLLIMLFNVCFLIVTGQIIGYQKILINFPIYLRIILILGICIFPIINISVLVGSIYLIKNNNYEKQKEISDEIDTVIENIKQYAVTENYDNIKWNLYGWSNRLEEVSCSLYKKEKINEKEV